MIRSAVINDTYTCYEDTMCFFSDKILLADDVEFAEEFYFELGDYLDESKYPCTKMILNPFYGSGNEFVITFKYDNKEVCRCVFGVVNELIIIKNAYYTENCLKEMFHKILEAYFDSLNQAKINIKMSNYGFKDNDENEVTLDYYDDYAKTETTTILKGTLNEIFDKYTTMNDRLKYCNGSYYKFNDKKVEEIYCLIISNYKGNYFLDNAVRRGCIID